MNTWSGCGEEKPFAVIPMYAGEVLQAGAAGNTDCIDAVLVHQLLRTTYAVFPLGYRNRFGFVSPALKRGYGRRPFLFSQGKGQSAQRTKNRPQPCSAAQTVHLMLPTAFVRRCIIFCDFRSSDLNS